MEKTLNTKQNKPKKQLSNKQKKNITIWASIGVVFAIALSLIYYFAITVWLVDLQNLGYLRFTFAISDEGTSKTASITKLDVLKNYPENFVFPSKFQEYEVVSIGEGACENATRLKSVTLPESIVSIGERAFQGCTNLETISFSSKTSEIGYNAFNKTKWVEQLPDNEFTVVGQVLYSFNGDFSTPTAIFNNAESATKYPDYSAFTPMYWDEKLSGKSFASIGGGLFEGKTNLKFVELPTAMNNVPDYAFSNCRDLIDVEISEHVLKIGNHAFENCQAFIGEGVISSSMTSLGNYAFANTNICGMLILPDSLGYIGEGAFSGCEEIISATMPNNNEIDYVANGLFSGDIKLANISFPNHDAITSIGNEAFKNTALIKIDIPKNVNYIGVSAFEDCSLLSEVNFATSWTTGNGEENNPFIDHGLAKLASRVFASSSLQTVRLYDVIGGVITYSTPMGEVNLPSSLQSIGSSADASEYGNVFLNTKIKKIIIPGKVSEMTKEAFKNCTMLEEVVFDNNSSTGKPIIKQFADGLFLNCSALGSIVIPDSIEMIAGSAFEGCSSLTNVTYPENSPLLVTIENRTYKNATSLAYLELPATISEIKTQAFAFDEPNANLNTILMKGELVKVDRDAFVNLENLNIFVTDTYRYPSSRMATNWDSENSLVRQGKLRILFGEKNLEGKGRWEMVGDVPTVIEDSWTNYPNIVSKFSSMFGGDENLVPCLYTANQWTFEEVSSTELQLISPDDLATVYDKNLYAGKLIQAGFVEEESSIVENSFVKGNIRVVIASTTSPLSLNIIVSKIA